MKEKKIKKRKHLKRKHEINRTPRKDGEKNRKTENNKQTMKL